VTHDETDTSAMPPEPTAQRAKRVILFAVIAFVVLVLDLVSKIIVVAKLPEPTETQTGHAPVRLLGGAIYLDQTRNSGAAFSLGTGFTIVLTAVAIAVVVVIVRTAGRMRSTGWATALGLVLGGALGNLADRARIGAVIDFIDPAFWPAFNVADAAIVLGILGFLYVIEAE
jgi:signal peptidase II